MPRARVVVGRLLVAALAASCCAAPARAQAPLDLWTPERLQKIRDRSTLNLSVTPQTGYVDVFFDSEIGDAKWGDSGEPYLVHTGDTVRIHGFLAVPPGGSARPALVLGHGHGGHGDPDVARAVAALGYAALSIDGPNAGLSTGGPHDTDQGWLSVEEIENQPAPEVGYLYHYAYAGMRALTALEALAAEPHNPYKIDPSRLGVVGASMGGVFTYYINGVDDRVKAAVGIAVAGDWKNIMEYEGSWLYHRLYYDTRDGLRSGLDALNAVSGCDDPTLRTFLSYFDPIGYAPTQHAPLLTIVGTHDQYFAMPSINSTYDRTEAAGTSDRFAKRLYMAPNGKHGVVDGPDALRTIVQLLGTVGRWLQFAFDGAPRPPQTPAVRMSLLGPWMIFKATAPPGGAPNLSVRIHLASRLDSTPDSACDFATLLMLGGGSEFYSAVPIGYRVRCGPALTPDNVLYFASVTDTLGSTVSSKMYYRSREMAFGQGFVPTIEHEPGDDFPVPPPPSCDPATLP